MNVILLGPPGAGKGTQAKMIEDQFGLKQLSSGDMLRSAVAAGTEVGKRAKAYMDDGKLVPDEVVVDIVFDTIDSLGHTNGFILDGFPRTARQAEALDTKLAASGRRIDWAILFDVDNELLVKRIAGRFTCATCGEGYHDIFKRPAKEGVCDRCGGTEFKRRADDNEATVRKRLEVYHAETAPLIDYYRAAGKLRAIDGEQPIEDVAQAVRTVFAEKT